jgi:hypothetical protein
MTELTGTSEVHHEAQEGIGRGPESAKRVPALSSPTRLPAEMGFSTGPYEGTRADWRGNRLTTPDHRALGAESSDEARERDPRARVRRQGVVRNRS